MDVKEILKGYENKIVSPGGGIYLNYLDSLDFIQKCKKNKILIYRIEILKITFSKKVSSLEKIIDYDDQNNYQEEVYTRLTEFIKDQMDEEWNYAIFVTG